MITINSLEEMEKYYNEKYDTYVFYDDVKFTINIEVKSDINAWNIEALDIKAYDINAYNIKAKNIEAYDIKAYDIKAFDIDACNIKAQNIDAQNIDALGINAQDINYYAYCIAYCTFKCKSAKSSRDNSICKCLDGKIEYIK